MATVAKPYRLVNPGRKSRRNPRKMSLKQKLHFGTARQRAAARVSMRGKRSNAGKRSVRKHLKQMKKVGFSKSLTSRLRREWSGLKRRPNTSVRRTKKARKREFGATKSFRAIKYGYISGRPLRAKKRRKNVGSILTVFNPGSVKHMAKRRRRNRYGVARRTRRRNVTYVGKIGGRRSRAKRYEYKANPRRRRRNPARSYARRSVRRVMHRRHHRRNPGFLSGGSVTKVLVIIGGATVTKLVTEQASAMVSMISSGIPSYIAGALIAFLQGKVLGKLFKSPALAENLQIGGYTYVALKVLGDLVPSLSLPFGLNGMGLITSSANFGAPYVPVPGSMTRFVTPGGVVGAIPPPMVTGVKGLGRTGMGARRMGRMA